MADRDPQIGKGRNASAYEADYGAWVETQAALLREGRFDRLDLANLIDEVESLGKSDFHKFESAIKIVLLHLLKWDVQTDHRSRSWADSIEGHRRRVMRELESSPSYKARLDEAVIEAYHRARFKAHKETKLPMRTFPESCPYSWDDIMTRTVVFDADETMKSIT